MPGPLKSPYDPTGKLWRTLHKISAQVSHDDFIFFKNLFPADGTVNALVANLFKNLVDELREHNTEAPIERAWYVDSESYTVLLGFLQRRADRRSAGHTSSRNESATTGGLREAMCDPTQQCSDKKVSLTQRRKAKATKGKEKKQGRPRVRGSTKHE